MKCDFCGHEFEKTDSMAGCRGCPMNNSCQKIKCPKCNYEMYPEPEYKTLKTIKGLAGKLMKKFVEER